MTCRRPLWPCHTSTLLTEPGKDWSREVEEQVMQSTLCPSSSDGEARHTLREVKGKEDDDDTLDNDSSYEDFCNALHDVSHSSTDRGSFAPVDFIEREYLWRLENLHRDSLNMTKNCILFQITALEQQAQMLFQEVERRRKIEATKHGLAALLSACCVHLWRCVRDGVCSLLLALAKRLISQFHRKERLMTGFSRNLNPPDMEQLGFVSGSYRNLPGRGRGRLPNRFLY